MRVKTRVLGAVSANCYLVYNEGTKKVAVVDPMDNVQLILNKCNELGITPEAVLLTHEHFDHIMATEGVRRSFHIKIYASETEDVMLSDSGLNPLGGWAGKQTSFHTDVLFKDGDELELIGFRRKVIGTPGRTTGSVCCYVPEEEMVSSGGTLFCKSYGRTDLPTGSSSRTVSSLLDKVFALPDDTMAYPGHGDTTTIRHEKKNNPITFYR